MRSCCNGPVALRMRRGGSDQFLWDALRVRAARRGVSGTAERRPTKGCSGLQDLAHRQARAYRQAMDLGPQAALRLRDKGRQGQIAGGAAVGAVPGRRYLALVTCSADGQAKQRQTTIGQRVIGEIDSLGLARGGRGHTEGAQDQ